MTGETLPLSEAYEYAARVTGLSPDEVAKAVTCFEGESRRACAARWVQYYVAFVRKYNVTPPLPHPDRREPPPPP